MVMDANKLLSLPPRIIRHSYTRRDTILYALGVGAGQDGGAEDLQYVYEEGLQALPTMAVILAYPGFWQKEPQYGIDWQRVLHVEQSVVLHAPLPVEGTVVGELTIDSIIDKGPGKGALLHSTRRVTDSGDGTLLATVRQVSFLRGDGGCGGSTQAPQVPTPMPERAADAELELPTRPDQALLYRLSGDYNPLHADPHVAKAAGLDSPILHGLCTFGIAGRALLRMLCDGDGYRIVRMDCRFTAPVYPGDTLLVKVWRNSAGHAAFQVLVPARNAVVLNFGYAKYGVE